MNISIFIIFNYFKDGNEVKRRNYVMGQSEISINKKRGRLSITVTFYIA